MGRPITARTTLPVLLTGLLWPARIFAVEPDAGLEPPGLSEDTASLESADAAVDVRAASSMVSDASSALPKPVVEDRPAFLHGTVNEVDMGDVFVILRGQDVLVRRDDLRKAGLRIDVGAGEKRGEDNLVSLLSLVPGVSFAMSERNLTLTITADPALFARSVLDLRAKRPEGILYGSAPSLFVNYQVRGGELQSGRSASLSGFAESGLGLHGHLLYASGQRSADTGTWQRLLTNLTFDVRDRLSSVVVGDTSLVSDALGGGGTMGGLCVGRNFGLDPYYVYLPTQRLSGTALTPSTVEIYVNGQLVRRENLPPGQFSMQNLPVTSGSGDTRIVIRDALGGTQTMVSPYYVALGTLAKGLQDFSYNVGFLREGLGSESWHYGNAEFLFRHRVGITDWLTLGGRVEGTWHLVSAAPSLALRLPFGELGLSGALSDQNGLVGAAGLASYSYMGIPIYFQIGVRGQSAEYANLVLSPSSVASAYSSSLGTITPTDRQRFDLTSSVAKNITRMASLSLQYQATNQSLTGWNHRITFMVNRGFARWFYAFATFTQIYTSHYPTEYDTFFGLSFAPADRVTAGVTRADRWGGQSGRGGGGQAMVQQSLPLGPGFGYRVVAAEGDNDLNQANAQYQGAYGRIEADYQRQGWGTREQSQRAFYPTWVQPALPVSQQANESGHATLTAYGGFVLIGGKPFLTRSVQDSFALIRVPGVSGVRGLLSNQVVGQTDRDGDLLIPSLLHYYGNRVGIDDKDIPLDHDIGAIERTIAPPYRGGMVVGFPVRRVQSVSGKLVVDEKGMKVVPAYGQVVARVGERRVVSPLDEAGNFYLEDIAPGTYQAEVQYASGVCAFPLVVPVGKAALVEVGEVSCLMASGSQP